VIVRPAEPRDDEVLLRIESMAGQGDRIRLIDERDSFFSRARQFSDTILLVGENEATGALHGVVAAAVQRLLIQGQEHLGAYMFDLRSNPEANKGLSRAMFFLWRGLEERLMERGVEFIFGLIKEDNSRSYSIAQRMGARACGERRFFTIPTFRRRRPLREVKVARRIDARQEYTDLRAHYADFNLLPAVNDFDHMQSLYDHYLVARLECEESSLKLWDISRHYTRRVAAMPRAYELAGSVLRGLSRFIPLPRVPAPGEAINVWNVLDVVTRRGREDEVKSLLAQANNMAVDHGIDYLIVAVDAEQAELAWLRRMAIMSLNYKVMVKEYQPAPALVGKTYLDPRWLG